jgi:hypothetical protein
MSFLKDHFQELEEIFMEDSKIELSGPHPIRLPVDVIKTLKAIARDNQRSLSQEMRLRILDSFSRIPEDQFE